MTGNDASFWSLAPWIALALAGLAGSALWSGLETGLYSLSRARLGLRLSNPRDRAARWMQTELDHPDRALTTVLIGNNVCNYAGTLGITAMLEAADLAPAVQIVGQVLVLSPLLLVFGEALPKNLMRLEADVWPYYLVYLLRGVRWLATACGLLPLIGFVSSILTRTLAIPASDGLAAGRHRVAELLRETVPTGALSLEQASLVDRAFEFERATVNDVMIPWASAATVRETWDIEHIRRVARRSGSTRLPVVDGAGRVRGVINQIRLATEPGASVRALTEPAPRVMPETNVREALERLRAEGARLAIVERGRRPQGLVTTKDLIEPLVGPLEAG